MGRAKVRIFHQITTAKPHFFFKKNQEKFPPKTKVVKIKYMQKIEANFAPISAKISHNVDGQRDARDWKEKNVNSEIAKESKCQRIVKLTLLPTP